MEQTGDSYTDSLKTTAQNYYNSCEYTSCDCVKSNDVVSSEVNFFEPITPDTWNSVKIDLDKYEDELIKEKNLIYEACCPIKNTLFQVSTGLSAVREFLPVVKILNWQDQTITFTKEDWSFFIHFLSLLSRNYFIKNTEQSNTQHLNNDVHFGEYRLRTLISFEFGNGLKIIELEKGDVNFWFGESTTKEIIDMEEMVLYRIKFLEELDFYNFHKHLTEYLKNISAKKIKYTIPTNLYCMREMLMLQWKKL